MRESYRRIFSPIAERRIHNTECPNCGKPKSEWERRTSWRCCSKECTEQFWKEHDESWSWDNFRLQVFKRDNGVCKMCGKKFIYMGWRTENTECPDYTKLIADHIKPLAMGGEMWDMNNLQTLCIDCNKIKTAQDMKVIAEYRAKEKILEKNQTLDIR